MGEGEKRRDLIKEEGKSYTRTHTHTQGRQVDRHRPIKGEKQKEKKAICKILIPNTCIEKQEK